MSSVRAAAPPAAPSLHARAAAPAATQPPRAAEAAPAAAPAPRARGASRAPGDFSIRASPGRGAAGRAGDDGGGAGGAAGPLARPLLSKQPLAPAAKPERLAPRVRARPAQHNACVHVHA
jgi:hypothetical protein